MVPAPMWVGGDLKYADHFLAVAPASCCDDFRDQASNAAKPSADPPVARQVAMPIAFQPSQSSLLGMTLSAAAMRPVSACGSSPVSCGSPPLVACVALSFLRVNPNSSTRSLVAASRKRTM